MCCPCASIFTVYEFQLSQSSQAVDIFAPQQISAISALMITMFVPF